MALANQNGLSNKCVSERHYYASKEKHTAGEASKILKKQGIQLKAKELVEAYKLLNGQEPEWHHAGFYKNNGRSTMGRTFFFSDEEVNEMIERWSEIENLMLQKAEKEKEMAETTVYGFYYKWNHDYSGKYGKKRNYKVLKWYEGNELDIPRNFTECDQNFYEAYKHISASYYGWDEPTISDIESRS